MSRHLRCSALVLLLCTVPAGAAQAGEPWVFDRSNYQALADADSGRSIAPGTRIGTNNWRKYKDFLPISMQALLSGAYNWRLPPGPDGEIVVGPTIPIPLPYQYRQDTEKYSRTTAIVRLPGGNIDITGYVAGRAFPDVDPAASDAVYKVIYNAYFTYWPAVLMQRYDFGTVDAYMNQTEATILSLWTRLNHVSEEGFPRSNPAAPADYLFATANLIEAPEQARYGVNLEIYYDDPSKVEEIYFYLPSLRRALRRSTAARCSPVLNSDEVFDDLYTRPVRLDQFSYHLIGRKLILAQLHVDPRHFADPKAYNTKSAPGWPKPSLGPWELRKVWVLEERSLPSNRDYCYGARVSYLDTDTLLPVIEDLYDPDLRLWKMRLASAMTGPTGDRHGSMTSLAGFRVVVLDFRNTHASYFNPVEPGAINLSVPEKYRDAQLWALPSGLSQVMR